MLKRVMVDMDETIVNLTDPWFDILNEQAGTSFTRDDVNMYDCVKFYEPYLSEEEVLKPFYKPGFWLELPPLDGAIDAIKILAASGYNVFILSSPWYSQYCAWEKTLWVEKHLKFLGPNRLILTRNKYLIDADYFVDDHVEMIQYCKGKKILIDRGWNREHDCPPGWFKRVRDMEHAASYILEDC